MKITKPSWLNHEGTSILSCDFHPDGTKFVTSGQGKQGGLVIIWKIQEFFNKEYSASFFNGEDARIAVLDDHVGCVNCVKFSPCGKYLASGGDDNVVIIWKGARTRLVYNKNSAHAQDQDLDSCEEICENCSAHVLDEVGVPAGLTGLTEEKSGLISGLTTGLSGTYEKINVIPGLNQGLNNNTGLTGSGEKTDLIPGLNNNTGLDPGLGGTSKKSGLSGLSPNPVLGGTNNNALDKGANPPINKIGGCKKCSKKLVERIKNSSDTFQESYQESWRAGHILHGHTADIIDLRWSQTGEFLATCSIDSNILIWNSNNFAEIIACLKGHTNFVKGICWDPLEEYIASQSDDKSLNIWPVSDIHSYSNRSKKNLNIKPLQEIKKPFKHCTNITQFLRLDWSPDGQFLVSAHALNNDGPVAQIVERESWSYQKDLVGHRQPVTVVKFSPVIYSKNGETRIMLAVASKDCSISIWLFPKPRAVFVINDLFVHSAMDLSWSKNGKNLAAVSWDGTVAFISLEDTDIIGDEKLCDQNITDSYKKICQTEDIIDDIEFYKSHLQTKTSVTQIDSQTIPIKPVSTQAATKKIEKEPPSKIKKLPDMGNDKQIETVGKDGKRRIKPIMMAKVVDDDESEVLDDPIQTSKPDIPLAQISSQPIQNSQTTETDSTALPIKAKKRTTIQPAEQPKPRFIKSQSPDIEEDLNYVESNEAQQVLDSPPIEKSLTIDMIYRDREISIKATNTPFCQDPKLYRVDIDIESSHEWSLAVTSPITLLASSKSLFCFTTEDNKIYCYSIEGVKLLPTLISRHPVSILKCHSDKYILIVTVYALLTVWDITESQILIDENDIEHLILDQKIDSICMNDHGMPILTNSEKYSFVYNLNLKTWLPAISQESLIQLKNVSENPNVTPNFFTMKNVLEKRISNTRHVQRMAPNLKEICNSTFGEDALYSSLYIGSTDEFLILLRVYMRQLCRMDQKLKIRSLFEFILREDHESLLINKHLIKQIDKSELLNCLLNILSETPKMQTLFSELKKLYSEQSI